MNNFQKLQAAKMLACYITPEELDIEKAHPEGYINKYGKQKQADGSWKYVGKGKATKQESKSESNPEQDAIEEHFENKYKNLHEAYTKEVDAHYEKMNTDSLHHQKLYNDAMKENKSNEELKKLSDAHNESHIKNQEDLKALHSKHDRERSTLIKEYNEARKQSKGDSTEPAKGSSSKVIGHTKSGKPVYDSHANAFGEFTDENFEHHSSFSPEEKEEAGKIIASHKRREVGAVAKAFKTMSNSELIDTWMDLVRQTREKRAKLEEGDKTREHGRISRPKHESLSYEISGDKQRKAYDEIDKRLKDLGSYKVQSRGMDQPAGRYVNGEFINTDDIMSDESITTIKNLLK